MTPSEKAARKNRDVHATSPVVSRLLCLDGLVPVQADGCVWQHDATLETTDEGSLHFEARTPILKSAR